MGLLGTGEVGTEQQLDPQIQASLREESGDLATSYQLLPSRWPQQPPIPTGVRAGDPVWV